MLKNHIFSKRWISDGLKGDAQLELECALDKNDQICIEYAMNSSPINKFMPKGNVKNDGKNRFFII